MEDIKKKVREWWSRSPCCSVYANSPLGTKSFFDEVDLYKDINEPFVDTVADYSRWRDKRVLEIGCGLGKDLARFILNGAKVTGIDFSESIEFTKKRLKIFNLKGNLCRADAEFLPFKDESFDLIYSWGVLHHTPGTQNAIDEIFRCLKSNNGHIIIMLYSKHSLVNIGIIYKYFVQSCRFWLITIKRKLFPTLANKSLDIEYLKPGKTNRMKFLAAYTDGIGNPFSKVYSRREVLKMFSRFKNIRIRAYECKNSNFKSIFNRFAWLEKYLGWFMVITAEK